MKCFYFKYDATLWLEVAVVCLEIRTFKIRLYYKLKKSGITFGYFPGVFSVLGRVVILLLLL